MSKSKREYQEPAFPVADLSKTQEHGMSLRDYFAGQAIVLAGVAAIESWDKPHPPLVNWPVAARAAYKIADAMLAERNRSSG